MIDNTSFLTALFYKAEVKDVVSDLLVGMIHVNKEKKWLCWFVIPGLTPLTKETRIKQIDALYHTIIKELRDEGTEAFEKEFESIERANKAVRYAPVQYAIKKSRGLHTLPCRGKFMNMYWSIDNVITLL